MRQGRSLNVVALLCLGLSLVFLAGCTTSRALERVGTLSWSQAMVGIEWEPVPDERNRLRVMDQDVLESRLVPQLSGAIGAGGRSEESTAKALFVLRAAVSESDKLHLYGQLYLRTFENGEVSSSGYQPVRIVVGEHDQSLDRVEVEPDSEAGSSITDPYPAWVDHTAFGGSDEEMARFNRMF